MKILVFFSWAAIVIGAFFTIALIGVYFEDKPETDQANMFVGWIFIGLVPMVLGFVGKRFAKRKGKTTSFRSQQHQLLQLAKKKQGKVSVSDVSLGLNISLKDAQKLLEDHVKRSFAEPEVDYRGVVIYVFKEFLTD
jgi:hypothetical protein